MNADERRLNPAEMRNAVRAALLGGFILLAGCSDNKPTTQPTSIRDRQDAALKDPFGYSADVNKERDVSGGGIFELDKDGLKKDLDHALNP